VVDESSKTADRQLIASTLASSNSQTKGLGFFRRMNLVIFLMVVAIFAAIFIPTAWDTRALNFQEAADGTFRTTISRFGRSYEIERIESTGSGQYVDLKISELESIAPGATPQKKDVATYSTCGHYRDEGTQLVIFEPQGFHCDLFSSRINDLLWPRKSRVDFSPDGATPSFLPQE
jgi:hypothetical protein